MEMSECQLPGNAVSRGWRGSCCRAPPPPRPGRELIAFGLLCCAQFPLLPGRFLSELGLPAFSAGRAEPTGVCRKSRVGGLKMRPCLTVTLLGLAPVGVRGQPWRGSPPLQPPTPSHIQVSCDPPGAGAEDDQSSAPSPSPVCMCITPCPCWPRLLSPNSCLLGGSKLQSCSGTIR